MIRMADKLERIYTIPLGDAYEAIRNKRTRKAVKLIRQFAGRHMKAEEEDIKLSMALNEYLWERSIQKPPRKVKVRLIKEDGKVNAYLADEKIEEKEEKKPEEKKEEKPKEAPKEKPEEKKMEELKKDQKQRAEQAMADKEAKKEIADEKAKIERAEKKKLSHGKETAAKTG